MQMKDVPRVVFGAYLAVHFAMLAPWAREVFVDVLPRDASPLLHLFPNVLAFADVATPLIAIAAVASLFFAAGVHDRVAAVAIWYVLACLFGRNPLISNPSLPFAGFLLVAHALFPSGDRRAFNATWIVMAIGYTYSGWTKLVSPSWLDGSAVLRVLENPLARPSAVRDLALATPEPLLQLATWGALALELLYAPLALSKRIRPAIWGAMLALHLGLLVLIDFADLTFMMVVLHLYTYDREWLPRRVATYTAWPFGRRALP